MSFTLHILRVIYFTLW